MKSPHSHPALALALLGFSLAATVPNSRAQGDNFDDGNSDGWTELAPLELLPPPFTPVPGTFSFPGGNTYRMQSGPSPDEGIVGQSRIGAIREDVTYDDFYMSVDLVDHDLALDQNVGLLARVTNPGLQSTNGYGVTYNPVDQAMFFTVINNEEGTNIDIGENSVPVVAGEPVRLVFQAEGDMFKFEIFELDDLANAVASFEITDNTYSSGFCGVFAVTDAADPAKPVDVTWDNYFATTEEPLDFRVVDIEIDGEDIVFEFLSKPGEGYSLWISDDLMNWEEFDDGIVGAAGEVTTHRHTPTMQVPAGERQFYQFRKNT